MQNADLALILKPTNALALASRAPGTYDSTGVDVLSFEAVYMHFYSLLNNGATGTFKLQTSATSGGTYTDVPGSTFPLGDSLNALPNVILKVRTRICQQFVRVRLTIAAATSACGVMLYFYDPAIGADQTTAHATGV